MSSTACEMAIAAATIAGRALLKTISANDAGTTGSHQVGYYLPKAAWPIYAPWAPQKGINHEQTVEITWPDGTTTESRVKWYGSGTRSEYRLTRFGRGFSYLQPECIGSLLVLVPFDSSTFSAWVLTTEAEIDEIQIQLGVELASGWAVFNKMAHTLVSPLENVAQCIEREFNAFASGALVLPSTRVMSETTQRIVQKCDKGFLKEIADKQLTSLVSEEYDLFKLIESAIYLPKITSFQGGLNEFLELAQTITQSRKARAGKSFEHHAEFVLSRGGVLFESQPMLDNTNPDIVIPGSIAYYYRGPDRPRVSIVGIKRTCKDRWRQVLNEAPQADKRYILTLQAAISESQLAEMYGHGVSLIVPSELHSGYPRDWRNRLYSVQGFIQLVNSEK